MTLAWGANTRKMKPAFMASYLREEREKGERRGERRDRDRQTEGKHLGELFVLVRV